MNEMLDHFLFWVVECEIEYICVCYSCGLEIVEAVKDVGEVEDPVGEENFCHFLFIKFFVLDLLFNALSFVAARSSKPIAEWIFNWRLFLFFGFLAGVEGEIKDHVELGSIFHIPLNFRIYSSDILCSSDGIMHAVID